MADSGKVCDMLYKSGTYVEQPLVCASGSCTSLQCASLNSTLLPCNCPREYTDYPLCCHHPLNTERTCIPYQWWMREYLDVRLPGD